MVFRNDLTQERALDLVCTTEGEVDLLTEVLPADAARVEASEHAKLVTIDAIRIMAGVINRDAEGLPLADKRARLALNLAVNRDRIVQDTRFGRAQSLAGLTPPSAVTILHRLSPYPHDPGRAAELWRKAGGAGCRPLRVAALGRCGPAVQRAAADMRDAPGIGAEVVATYSGDEELGIRRKLAQKGSPLEWDVLVLEHGAQAADGPPLELHGAFAGATGEFRAGPVVPEFEALALFLCAPQALYAVNRYLDFRPYRTTFELAESRVGEQHWSRR